MFFFFFLLIRIKIHKYSPWAPPVGGGWARFLSWFFSVRRNPFRIPALERAPAERYVQCRSVGVSYVSILLFFFFFFFLVFLFNFERG